MGSSFYLARSKHVLLWSKNNILEAKKNEKV